MNFKAIFHCCFWLIIISFSSCNSTSTEESDMKLNEYYNEFVAISNSYPNTTSDSVKIDLLNFLSKYPNDLKAYLLLARVNYDLFHDDSAMYYYYEVIKSDSNNIHALNGLSSLYSLKNNKDSAFFYINKSLSINDSFPYTIINNQYNNLYFSENLDTNSLLNLKLSPKDSSASIFLRQFYILNKIQKNEESHKYLSLFYSTGFKDSASLDLLINNKISLDTFFRKYKL